MAKIYIGTSGYSYKDWIGPFYPQDTAPQEFLNLYNNEFNFVELNFSYYRQPDALLLKRMAEKTHENFLFAIKAHKSMTHDISDNIAKDIEVFKQGIKPLIQAHKLGTILIQFPYSFHYTPNNRRHLAILSSTLAELPLALEFRNIEWIKEPVFSELEQRNICFVNVDQPDLPRLIKPSEIVTADLAYIRFHGRNRQMWWKGDNISRYDYLYDDDELQGWIERIKVIIEKAKILLIAFNNHSRGQAVQNARRLKELLVLNNIKQVH